MARARREVRSYRPDFGRGDINLTVSGFKAVRDETTIRIAPLTVISGANSSGKSSFMQPFLLMKQTLESAFDPGALLLYGPNVKFTEQGQVISRGKSKTDSPDFFQVAIQSGESLRRTSFQRGANGFGIRSDTILSRERSVELREQLTPAQKRHIARGYAEELESYQRILVPEQVAWDWNVSVTRNRCFLEASLSFSFDGETAGPKFPHDPSDSAPWSTLLQGIIHVPGLRGNPERAYQRSAVGSTYPGTFETYVASIIHSWAGSTGHQLTQLAHNLEILGLTWKVVARPVDDASLEVLVGRMPHAQQGGAQDLVSVADVGFGVSQTLPVVVALLVAQRGQIVYVEQPEIHLHPRAQLALVSCLIQASNRGVLVIIETHSSLIIRGIQTAIARNEFDSALLSMNWFSRDPASGMTRVDHAQVDTQGRFGEWPLDFDAISRDADWAYLEAVSANV